MRIGAFSSVYNGARFTPFMRRSLATAQGTSIPSTSGASHEEGDFSDTLKRDKYWIAFSFVFTIGLGSWIYSSHKERLKTRNFFTSSTMRRYKESKEAYEAYVASQPTLSINSTGNI